MGCAKTKKALVERLSIEYPISKLCELIGIPRSSYYKYLRQLKTDKDEWLANEIKECQESVKYTYGYRRMCIWLKQTHGIVVNHKRVARVMRKFSLNAKVYRSKRFSGIAQATYRYTDKLKRNFNAKEPNRTWSTDITQLYTKQGLLYLSVVKDLYDGMIVEKAM